MIHVVFEETKLKARLKKISFLPKKLNISRLNLLVVGNISVPKKIH